MDTTALDRGNEIQESVALLTTQIDQLGPWNNTGDLILQFRDSFPDVLTQLNLSPSASTSLIKTDIINQLSAERTALNAEFAAL